MAGWRVKALTATGVFGVMYALGLGFSLRLLNPMDESWFVQVVERMRAGDVLYRDIAYGAGPLPAYLSAAMTYVAGIDVLAVKMVVVLAFAGTATLAWLTAEELGLNVGERIIMLAGLAYFAPPVQQPPYGPLATMFLVAALLALVRFRGRAAAAVLGGGAAGLAFLSKPNVGLAVLGAVVAALLVERRLARTIVALASFSAVVGALLLPVALSGGFARYVDYGFTGKGAYLGARDASIIADLRGMLQTVRDVHSVPSAEAAYWALGLLVPFLALISLLMLILRTRRGLRHVFPLAAFAAVAAATLFPRFDTVHVNYAAPAFVLVLAYAAHVWRSRVPTALGVVVAAWLAIAVVAMATLPVRLARSPAANLSTLPHLHGAFVHEGDLSRWQRETAELTAATRGYRRVLLIVPDAGFRYLTSGLRNPTSFDFPFVTTFGRGGEQRVVEALAAREIGPVCMKREWSDLAPERIINYVRSTSRAGPRLSFCTLYRRTA
jgi:hypothetical protein